jgi:NADPH:quinone reductase-like Zn-dependent oxidoreductase
VACRELDIERDPASQGFAGQKYDVVIASNVLHATADLRATADRVRSLLAPGGTLLALEVFAPHHWFDLTVGLTPGWWLFTDVDLRPSYPAVSAAAWRTLLLERGFATAEAVPGTAAGDGVLARQGIVVGTTPAAASAEAGTWLVIGDTAGAVTAALEANGARCAVVAGAELAGLRRAGGLTAALLERFGSGTCRHVVYLAAAEDAPRCAAADRHVDEVCAAALDVAVAAASVDPALAPTVWFVTCGAQAVTGDEAALEPAQATLWGLGRTLDLEHPALGVYRVDLDPSNPYEQADVLARLLQSGVPERQIALRDGRAYVARVRHWAAANRAPVTKGAYEVVLGDRGSVDALAIRPAERAVPAPNEVEICVAATALNFKDVLNVLGLYPGDPGPLGSECAGVVVRVGRDVAGFAPGDRVMAFVGGAFKRYVCVPAWQVATIPAGLGYAAAATVPVAFLTAAYALWRCARLTAGDRVLIHAATGGVGMAALQLARAAGAEVYATAGTPAKRRLLASLGVTHIYDSRSLEFRDAILRDTAGRGVDVVLNSLADDFVAASFAVIARGGRFLEIGKRGIWSPERVAALGRDIDYHVIDWGVTAQQDAPAIRALLDELAGRLQRGEIEPLPVRSMPLRRLADAFRYMAQGRHIGKIVVTHEQPEDEPPRRDVVRADGTYVVAGGLSGIGLLTAEWLAARGARHLALFGRRAPDAEVSRRLAALRSAGVAIATASVDVADRAALAAFLDTVRGTHPPIRGVFQSTGVLDDGVLLHQTWQRFATVFAPKVRGSTNLHELTRGDPLECFVLYSSLAGMLGSAGQANHAAANAFLDTLAAARRLEGLPALSVNWGPWAEAGAAVRYGVVARGGTKGLAAISSSDAFDVLALALTRGLVNIGAADVNWAAFLAADGASSPFLELLHSTTARTDVKVSGNERMDGWLVELEALPAARRRTEILRFVRAQMVRLLGLSGGAVEIDRPLSELGLDSLLAVETRNVLGRAFAVTLPATVTFDHPSIEALADYLHTCKFETPSATAASVEPTSRDALASIEELADDDLDRLIEEKLRAHD